jgi:hypothetical protein
MQLNSEDESVGRHLFRMFLGAPNSFTRAVTYWTVSVLATAPFFALVPLLGRRHVFAYVMMAGIFLVLYQVTSKLVDRVSERLNKKYQVY